MPDVSTKHAVEINLNSIANKGWGGGFVFSSSPVFEFFNISTRHFNTTHFDLQLYKESTFFLFLQHRKACLFRLIRSVHCPFNNKLIWNLNEGDHFFFSSVYIFFRLLLAG